MFHVVGKYKARLEHKERPRDIPFLNNKRVQPAIQVPPPLQLAACQYLTTGPFRILKYKYNFIVDLLTASLNTTSAVPAFNRNDISENILNRLIKTTVTMVRPPKLRAHEAPRYIYLYENV